MTLSSERQQKFIKKMLGIKAKKEFKTIREVMDAYRIDYLDTLSKQQASTIIEKLISEGFGPNKNWGR